MLELVEVVDVSRGDGLEVIVVDMGVPLAGVVGDAGVEGDAAVCGDEAEKGFGCEAVGEEDVGGDVDGCEAGVIGVEVVAVWFRLSCRFHSDERGGYGNDPYGYALVGDEITGGEVVEIHRGWAFRGDEIPRGKTRGTAAARGWMLLVEFLVDVRRYLAKFGEAQFDGGDGVIHTFAQEGVEGIFKGGVVDDGQLGLHALRDGFRGCILKDVQVFVPALYGGFFDPFLAVEG